MKLFRDAFEHQFGFFFLHVYFMYDRKPCSPNFEVPFHLQFFEMKFFL